MKRENKTVITTLPLWHPITIFSIAMKKRNDVIFRKSVQEAGKTRLTSCVTLACYLGPCSGHAPEGPQIKHHGPMTSKQFKPLGVCQEREEAVTSPGLGSCSHNGEQWGSAPPWALWFLLATLGWSWGVAMTMWHLLAFNTDKTPFLSHLSIIKINVLVVWWLGASDKGQVNTWAVSWGSIFH